MTDQLIDFYEPMAIGKTPLIITGNMFISAGGKGLAREIGIDRDDRIPGLAQLADVVHANNSRIFGQINHCGRQSASLSETVSASAVLEPVTGARPRALSTDEIQGVVAEFAAAAERLQRAGFDGVQLHAAHGYLISQFLTPHTNRRSDEYGGSFDGRLRFAREVVAAVRERVGPDFPIIAKINGHDKLPGRAGLKTPDLVRIAKALQDDGVDGVEISVSHYESGNYPVPGPMGIQLKNIAEGRGLLNGAPPSRRRVVAALRPLLTVLFNRIWRYSEGFNLDYSRQFTTELSIPVICVGGWQHRHAIETALATGGCDAVSATRSFIADPLFFKHLVEDGAANPACTFCNACFGYITEVPLACLDPIVRAQQDEMLATEIGWRPRAASSGMKPNKRISP